MAIDPDRAAGYEYGEDCLATAIVGLTNIHIHARARCVWHLEEYLKSLSTHVQKDGAISDSLYRAMPDVYVVLMDAIFVNSPFPFRPARMTGRDWFDQGGLVFAPEHGTPVGEDVPFDVVLRLPTQSWNGAGYLALDAGTRPYAFYGTYEELVRRYEDFGSMQGSGVVLSRSEA